MRRRGFLASLAAVAVASAVQCFGAKKAAFEYAVTGQFSSDPICIVDATKGYKWSVFWKIIDKGPLPEGLGYNLQRLTTKENCHPRPLAIQWDTPTNS